MVFTNSFSLVIKTFGVIAGLFSTFFTESIGTIFTVLFLLFSITDGFFSADFSGVVVFCCTGFFAVVEGGLAAGLVVDGAGVVTGFLVVVFGLAVGGFLLSATTGGFFATAFSFSRLT